MSIEIELRIGRLVLDGVTPQDGAALRVALESELDQLLSRDPLTVRQDHHLHRVTTPPVPAAADPAEFGRRIARAVHSCLHGGAPRKAGRPA
ncbi:hypothetical protein GCM10018781_16460 [Kitasatospora indigofera]|uniref:Uncharacterized protein n=1 Tax=Kitasatospora indigofera TaxID=67307 RepID=A0A919FH29_9ACTN|nr:hypothetical protein [Kitasatospora indigofera]GHH64911.1 hypothetical protein GCM10018781_16460 [Kitasatospora indigofera]